jgi:hypothetical protein
MEPFDVAAAAAAAASDAAADAASRPFLKTPCGHAFHYTCLAQWVHDQRSARPAAASVGDSSASPPDGGCSCPVRATSSDVGGSH